MPFYIDPIPENEIKKPTFSTIFTIEIPVIPEEMYRRKPIDIIILTN